ncbi:hypothetical protein GCM10023222_31360 [Saccharopolyspora cebuensis]
MIQERPRAGTGKEAAPGTGKGATTGLVQPGAESSESAGAPGQIRYAEEPVRINEGRPVRSLRVVNTADRPVSVGSHYHFAEVNPALEFDREAAWGHRLNMLAGGMVRFDPGATVEVELVPFVGRRIVRGLRGEAGGALDG